MNAWQKWVNRPQNLGFRKFLFQVHLWVGIGVGLYILMISVSGSAIVYRRELVKKYARKPAIVAISGSRMSDDDLKKIAQQSYPGYEASYVTSSRRLDRAVAVGLEHGDSSMQRLFNPYTGENMGNPLSLTERVLQWLVDFHDNLLSGPSGRTANGIGSIFVTLLALTGAIIWWPGIKNWRRSLGVNWDRNFIRFNWDLHSALGFWCALFILVWGISGIYFSFPDLFTDRFSEKSVAWLVRLHFGRISRYTEILWTIFGLVPAVLFISGAIMWWNRVLRKKVRELD
jgi:uncharacterized iron-regulated membrane protein